MTCRTGSCSEALGRPSSEMAHTWDHMLNQTTEEGNFLFLQDYYCWDSRVLNDIPFALVFSQSTEGQTGESGREIKISLNSDKPMWATWLKCVHMDLLIHPPQQCRKLTPPKQQTYQQGQSLPRQNLTQVDRICQEHPVCKLAGSKEKREEGFETSMPSSFCQLVRKVLPKSKR